MLTPSEARQFVQDNKFCRKDGHVYTDYCLQCEEVTDQDGVEGHNGFDSFFYTICRKCGSKLE